MKEGALGESSEQQFNSYPHTASRSRSSIKYDKPTYEDTRRAIKQLKNNNAAGPDDVPEALKTDIDTFVELLYSLFTKIWGKKKCHQTGVPHF